MSTLIDENGNPISPATIAALRERNLAGPDPEQSRSPFRAFVESDAPTPWMLATVLREAELGNSWRLQELAETMEERDLHYAGVLATRKRTVTQVPMRVEAASDNPEHIRHKQFLDDWIDAGGVSEIERFNMLDAIAKGFAVLEIEWRNEAGKILPACLTYRPQRWFEISRDDGESVMLRTQDGLSPLAPWKFVVHKHPSKSGLLLRAGLVRLACWAWMFKSFSIRDWGVFCQNYGQPVRLGRYGPDASPQDRAVLWRAVSGIAGDCAAIIPKSMEMEFKEVGNLSAAGDLYERRCDWLDKQVSKAVLGQTATTDANPGSHAAGRTHRQVQEDIERSDCGMLADTVTRQLFQRVIALNFPGYTGPMPRCAIGQPDDVPLSDIITALQWAGPQGLTLPLRQMRDRLGFDEPEGDEPLVGGVAKPTLPTVPRTDPKRVKEVPAVDPNPQRPNAEVEQQPGDPRPPAIHAVLGGLLARHTREVDPDTIEALTDRLAEDARGALAGMTEQVRHTIAGAKDLRDLADRLATLQLDHEQYTRAIQAGIAVAQLAGQASLLQEIGRGS